MNDNSYSEEQTGDMMYDVKTKHGGKNFIDLEEAEEGVIYKITINPPDDMRSRGKEYLLTEVPLFIAMIKKFIYSYIEVYPELSPNGRLHYHGYIIIEDLFGFYSHDIRLINSWCNFVISKLKGQSDDHLQEWVNYVQKQMKVMKPAFDKIGVLYKVTNKNK